MEFAKAARHCVEVMGPDVVRDSRRFVSCLLDCADDSLAMRAAARNLDDAALAPFVEALDAGGGDSLALAAAKVEMILRDGRGLNEEVAHVIASAVSAALQGRPGVAAGAHERGAAGQEAKRRAAKAEVEPARGAGMHASATVPAAFAEVGEGAATVPSGQGRGVNRRAVLAGMGALALAALAANLGNVEDSTSSKMGGGAKGESRVGDISNMSRTERAELFAMVVDSRMIANGQGSYVDYTQRDEDLTKLVAETSDLYTYLTGTGSADYVEHQVCSTNYESPIISERAHVMATDGDAYAVVADETATSETEYWGPNEFVVIFDEDDMIEHAYRMDDYRFEVLGMQSQNDYMESYPMSSDREELSPLSGQDCVTFKTDDFAVELPGPWTLSRCVPSSRENVFGLQNDGYYFYSSEYGGQFSIGLETFDLESYGGSWLCEVIGFNSNWKQVTIWWHNELPQDVKDYIVEHLTIL